MIELKSCPFCGTKIDCVCGSDNVGGKPYWFVACPVCGGSVYGDREKEKAIERWNRRSAEDNACAVEEETEAEKQPEIILCKECKHYHENVFGGDIGLGRPYDSLIVGHRGCDRWGNSNAKQDMCYTDPDGYCFMAERAEVGLTNCGEDIEKEPKGDKHAGY